MILGSRVRTCLLTHFHFMSLGKWVADLGKWVAGYELSMRSASAFYSVKLCVMINFSLRHNVLCFSFVVVLYSNYSLYAIIKVVLFNERDCHV